MAINDPNPNNPKKPAIAEVIKLIGICNPNDDPKTFAKKINNAPTINLTTPFDVYFIISVGAPNNKSKTIIAMKHIVIKIGSISNLLSLVLL